MTSVALRQSEGDCLLGLVDAGCAAERGQVVQHRGLTPKALDFRTEGCEHTMRPKPLPMEFA
jgi:hypothetical protein